jgi:hypothetical protein
VYSLRHQLRCLITHYQIFLLLRTQPATEDLSQQSSLQYTDATPCTYLQDFPVLMRLKAISGCLPKSAANEPNQRANVYGFSGEGIWLKSH